MISSITVAGQSVTLVDMPTKPGMRSVEFKFRDAVALNVSPFTGQTQAQQWPGADQWTGTMTLPTMCQTDADAWISFLMACRGMANAFLLGDPLKTSPAGNLQRSLPLVDSSGSGWNAAGSQVLHTKGWTANAARLLLPGDYVQVGYRLHRNLGVVSVGSDGLAALQVWPSLREVPVDGAPLILNHPRGLFRRANNEDGWSATIGRITSQSFQVAEYR